MRIENFDIDGIVRDILADLSTGSKVACPEPKTDLPDQRDGIFIDRRVISLADVKGLGDARKLLLAPKSILTPSAKDEIRKRKIEVSVRLPLLAAERSSALWLAVQRPATFPSSIAKRFNAKPDVFETVAAVVEGAVKKLTGMRGVALSRQAATLLCEANRHKEIRAIFGCESKQTAEDADEVDANLLVLHPDRVVADVMMDIIQMFLSRGRGPRLV